MSTETNLPLISIALSVYQPNLEFLEKQLRSLAQQTYPNLELLVRNDCPDVPVPDDIWDICREKMPIYFLPANENLGFVRSFEVLTLAAKGEFISYCDQDDIWEKEKISHSLKYLQAVNALAVRTDYALMDATDHVYIKSVRKEKREPYNTWYTGQNIIAKSFFCCYGLGATLLVDAKFAQQMIPFNASLGHDGWLLLCAASQERAAFLDEQLMRYRRHEENASGNLWKGIFSKEDYRKRYLYPLESAYQEYCEKFPDSSSKQQIKQFLDARISQNLIGIWKSRNLSPKAAFGECLIKCLPAPLFYWFLTLKNRR